METLASWAMIATEDRAAGMVVVRSMAERAGTSITEIQGSHVVMLSQPRLGADVILSAIAGVSPAPVSLAAPA
jgi:hypothetical protein